jgi:hypothetical protein
MSRRLLSRRRHSGEDGARSIYADGFLALMLVGLGSAIVTSSSPSPAAQAATSTTVAITKTFQLSCTEFVIRPESNLSPEVGGKQIEAAVGEEIARRGWAPDTAKPGFVIVMGGFSGNEGPGDGSNRAKSLQPALRKSTPMLRAVEMRAIGSKAAAVNGAQQAIGGAGSYLLVVYLLYSGPQLEEDCTK